MAASGRELRGFAALVDCRVTGAMHRGWRLLGSCGELKRRQALGVIKRARPERSIIFKMKVATGKVIEGKVVVEGLPLEEGSVVTVLARDREETFHLSPEEEAEILLSIAEADRDETLSGDEVLQSLPRSRA
jgi:hypothetical protein